MTKYTEEEDKAIVEGIKLYGINTKLVQTLIPQRSRSGIYGRMLALRRGQGTLDEQSRKVLFENKKTINYWSASEVKRLNELSQKIGSYAMKLVKYFPGKWIKSIYKKLHWLRNEQYDPKKKFPAHFTKWTDEEQKRLIEGVKRFGKDYKSIAKHVRTKDHTQVYARARLSFKHKGFPKIEVAKYKGYTD